MSRSFDLLRGALGIAREGLRLVLRRPVVSVVAVAIDSSGRHLLMRRRDDGQWSLPGGLMDWGERLEETLRRELCEETGYEVVTVGRVIGIYSDPRRDARFHAIAIAVECRVAPSPHAPPPNPMEVMEVGAFAGEALPAVLSFDGRRILADYALGKAAVLD